MIWGFLILGHLPCERAPWAQLSWPERFVYCEVDSGQVAQLVRAFGLHPKGHRFEPCLVHRVTTFRALLGLLH